MENNKKVSAAIAAVLQYIVSEEEIVCMAAASAAQAPAAPSLPIAPLKMWGVVGRQQMMQMRSLMQMKSFHGFKVR
ncbi:MAG: hypothetical protein K9L30_16150 [Desulfobacterales bacterium]|nr:hypothetical protein [Desulfobacterales bacterium]